MRLAFLFRVILTTLILPLLFSGGMPAYAAAPLAFSGEINQDPVASRALLLLTNAAPDVAALRGSVPSFARGELNGDATSELFLRFDFSEDFCPLGCTPLVFVFVQGPDGLRIVGHFFAFRVFLADTVTFGVRDLMLYNDPKNDFGWTRYVWTPMEHRYVPYRIDSRSLDSGDKGPSPSGQ